MSFEKALHPKTAIARRFLEDLQLQGLAESTQVQYMRAVRQLSNHYHKSPATITEEELRRYFLTIKNDRKWSASTFTINVCGIKNFYQHTLQKQWPVLGLIRPRKDKKLPVILSRDEVFRILAGVRKPQYRVCLQVIYSCGLRRKEGAHLQVQDIDSGRMMLHIRHGKGGKDRYVPLPERTLELIREYWSSHRNPVWIFPGGKRNGEGRSTATRCMGIPSLWRAFHLSFLASGIHKQVCVHTLRHSYATHLLEAGVNLRQIQEYLGHRSIMTTMIYTHLTEVSIQRTQQLLNRLMEGL
jgi:site-specific recombinase XerD